MSASVSSGASAASSTSGASPPSRSSTSSSRRRRPPPGGSRSSPTSVAGTPPRSSSSGSGRASPPPPPRLRRSAAASFDSAGSAAPLLGDDRQPRSDADAPRRKPDRRQRRRERKSKERGDGVSLTNERRMEQEALLGDILANGAGNNNEEGDVYSQLEEFGQKLEDELLDLEKIGVGSTDELKTVEEDLDAKFYTPKRTRKQGKESKAKASNGRTASRNVDAGSSVYSTTLTTPERGIDRTGRGSPASSDRSSTCSSSSSSPRTIDPSLDGSHRTASTRRSTQSGASVDDALSGPSLAAVQAADAARRAAAERYRAQAGKMEAVLRGHRGGRRGQKSPRRRSPSRNLGKTDPPLRSKRKAGDFRSEYEMLIRPDCLEGTAAAAAWHLHGQSGGRRYRDGGDEERGGCSVMDARALLAMGRRRCGTKGHGPSKDKNVPNMSIDVKEGCATLSAIHTMTHANSAQDQWSTGTAAAIVTGTAARYRTSTFAFPHGRRILLPLLTGMLAAALSLATILSCQFMTMVPHDGNELALQMGPWRYLSVNPTYSDGEVCLPYPSDMEMDLSFTVARSASALASCLGLALVLWTSTLMCIPASKGSLHGLGLCFALNGAVQSLTSLFYRSEHCRSSDNGTAGGYFGRGSCRPNQDLVFCLAATALYLATGWIVCLSRKFAVDALENSMEVCTWSSEAKSSDPKGGVVRTVEKSWTRIPDGTTVVATVHVERREGAGGANGGDGRTKTRYSIQTEILPA